MEAGKQTSCWGWHFLPLVHFTQSLYPFLRTQLFDASGQRLIFPTVSIVSYLLVTCPSHDLLLFSITRDFKWHVGRREETCDLKLIYSDLLFICQVLTFDLSSQSNELVTKSAFVWSWFQAINGWNISTKSHRNPNCKCLVYIRGFHYPFLSFS